MKARIPRARTIVEFETWSYSFDLSEEQGIPEGLESLMFIVLSRLTRTPTGIAKLSIERVDVVDAFLVTERATEKLMERRDLSFERWLRTKEGNRRLKVELQKMERTQGKPKDEVRSYYMETARNAIRPLRFKHPYWWAPVLRAERKSTKALSLDLNLAEFEYLLPPVANGADDVDEWVEAVCTPFGLEMSEILWAREVMQGVAYVGRVFRAHQISNHELLHRINALWRLTLPDHHALEQEDRLFRWLIQSFSKSLIGHVMQTRAMRKCQHPHCTSGPYFFPKRAWQTHCSPECTRRHAHFRYYAKKKREKKARGHS